MNKSISGQVAFVTVAVVVARVLFCVNIEQVGGGWDGGVEIL